MLRQAQLKRLTTCGTASLLIGLALIIWSIITQAAIVRAADVMVSATVAPTGSLVLTVFDQESTQTPPSAINFNNIATSDTDLFERTAAASVSDIRIAVQTNSNNWLLTQHVSPGHLTDGLGHTINLFWKNDNQSSYQIMGQPENPDLLGAYEMTTGALVDLDYALQAPHSTPTGAYSGMVTYTLSYN